MKYIGFMFVCLFFAHGMYGMEKGTILFRGKKVSKSTTIPGQVKMKSNSSKPNALQQLKENCDPCETCFICGIWTFGLGTLLAGR